MKILFLFVLVLVSIISINDAYADNHEVLILNGSSINKCDNESCLSPNTVTVFQGDTITWINQDSTLETSKDYSAHQFSANSTNGNYFPDQIVTLKYGERKSVEISQVTFSTLGSTSYFCMFHPWLVGEILVQKRPESIPEMTSEPEPIQETEPVSEPESTPEPEVKELGIAPFVDPTKDPQSYVDRYNDEPTYKKWFDENYQEYSSIYQAVGLESKLEQKIQPDTEIFYKFNERWNWKGSTSAGEGPGQFVAPGYIAIDSKDFVYVTDSTNRIQKFSSEGKFLTEWKIVENAWGNIEINSKDEIYVGIEPTHLDYKIAKLSLDGKIIETWGTEDSDNYKISIPEEKYFNFFIDNSDNLYVSIPELTVESRVEYAIKVLKYSPSGQLLKTFENMAQPSAQDDDGNLYGIGKCSVVKYNSLGEEIDRFGACQYRGPPGTFSSGAPSDIQIGTNGLIFVTGGGGSSISIFSEDGKVLGGIGSYGIYKEQYGSPLGIAIDSKNNVFFTDHARHSVFVYSPVEIIESKTIPESESNSVSHSPTILSTKFENGMEYEYRGLDPKGDPMWVESDRNYFNRIMIPLISNIVLIGVIITIIVSVIFVIKKRMKINKFERHRKFESAQKQTDEIKKLKDRINELEKSKDSET